jgi:uncharacterized protein YicC (UPF0701 family)
MTRFEQKRRLLVLSDRTGKSWEFFMEECRREIDKLAKKFEALSSATERAPPAPRNWFGGD